MTSLPRRHHYVPAFYLAQFTEGGERNSRLFVFDQSQIRSWPSTPGGSAYRKDFYAVKLENDQHPATLESKVLSDLDGLFSSVLKKVVAEGQIPKGKDYADLLNFVALTMARTPRARRLVDQVAAHEVNKGFKDLISTDEGWRSFLEQSPDSFPGLSMEELEECRELILNDEFDITVDGTSDKLGYNTWQVHQLSDSVDGLLPLLSKRKWFIGFAAAPAADFVCSDTPVSLALNEEFDDSDRICLTNEHTTIFMPLSRRAALIGSYQEWPSAFQFSESGVLLLNSLAITESTQIFSASEDFSYAGAEGRQMGKDDLTRALREGTYKHDNLRVRLDAWLNDLPPN